VFSGRSLREFDPVVYWVAFSEAFFMGAIRSLRTPSLRRHKPSSLGVVTLNGKDHYLGNWPESQKAPPEAVRLAYDRLIAEWLASGRRLHPAPTEVENRSLAINQLMVAFLRHAEGHYRREDGKPTSEVTNFKLSFRPLKELYGTLAATEFGPLKLKAVRQRMADARKYRARFQVEDGEEKTTLIRRIWEHRLRRADAGCEVLWDKKWRPAEVLSEEKALSRGVINRRIGRIVRLFKWGVSEELVLESVWRALTTVRGLEKGRTTVKENDPVGPVAAEVVRETLPFLLPPVRAMAELQLLTGMRPGEVCAMRACDLDMTKDIWLYRPAQHKTRHRGKDRVVAIGPKAQDTVRPFLKLDTRAFLFSPRDAVAALRTRQRANRKSRVQPSQADRRKRRPDREPGAAYTTNAYQHAVTKAILTANTANACNACKPLNPAERCQACQSSAVPHWHPHQLRHTHATEVRRRFGLEAAQVALGHSQAHIAEVYAERDMTLAANVAKQIG
jgi:integrase